MNIIDNSASRQRIFVVAIHQPSIQTRLKGVVTATAGMIIAVFGLLYQGIYAINHRSSLMGYGCIVFGLGTHVSGIFAMHTNLDRVQRLGLLYIFSGLNGVFLGDVKRALSPEGTSKIDAAWILLGIVVAATGSLLYALRYEKTLKRL